MEENIKKIRRKKEVLEVVIKEQIARFELETGVEVESVLVYTDFSKNKKNIRIILKI